VRLYTGREKIFPEFIRINGESFAINADFRNILRIFAMMGDENISTFKKWLKLREYFIKDSERLEMPEIIEAFGRFINNEKALNQGQNGDKFNIDEERQFCYEFDAEEIYASFLSEYNLDLLECNFLHWRKFKIMLENLPEASAFKKKIALRFLNLSGISRDLPGFSDILEARDAVRLPCIAEELETREFEEFWARV